MISTEQKNSITKTLGKNYITQILKFLKENNMEKKPGIPYSKSYISQILSGDREHDHIESLIFKLSYDIHYKKQDEKEYRKKFVKLTDKAA